MVAIQTGAHTPSELLMSGSNALESADAVRTRLSPSGRRKRRWVGVLGAASVWLLPALASAQTPTNPDPTAAPEPPAAAPGAPAPGGPEASTAPAAGQPSADQTPGVDAPLDDASLDPGAPPPAEGGSAQGAPGGLEEVVVTVDRRKKDLQTYSGVAAAFSENRLATVGVTNAREMASMVPGLQIGVQEGNTEIFIRGIGSDNNTELGDPAVALHIDGVYIPRPRGVGSMFFDIERVEVNSGPQGTLRGRNAMGGAVNIVSARPKLEEFGANAEATFGTFAERRYQGMVNIPVGSMLSFRFAGFSEVHDPYYQNAGPLYDHTAAENADAYAIRAQMLYQPTQRFSALVGYDLTAERGTGYLGANFQGPLTAVDASDPFNPVGIPFDVSKLDNPRRVYYTGMHPSVGLKHQGIRGELNFDSGPAIFQAIASYRWLRYQQVTGANAGAVTPGYNYANVNPDVFTNTLWDSRSQSLIAELRAFAPDSARLRWSAGAFYFNEDQQVFSGQVSDPAGNYAGAEFNMPDVKGGSVAAYADATFDVVQSFRVIGGVRLTHESKSRKNGLWAIYQGFSAPPGLTIPGGAARYGTEGYQAEGLSRTTYDLPKNADGSYDASVTNRVNLFLDGVKSFGARDTLPQVLCNDPIAALPGQAQTPRVIPNATGSGMRCSNGVRQNLSPNIVESVPQNNSDTDTYLDWRAGLEYDLAKDSLLYFTATTGHKAGGFNDTAPGAAPGELYDSTYKPESVLAFELGSKNQLLGRRLRLNGSAFAYSYKDMVFQTIAAVGDVGTTPGAANDENQNQAAPNTAVRQNAKTATPIYGFDLDAIYALPAGLEAEAHLLLMDAKFKNGTIARDTRISDTPAENYDVDLGGHWLPRVSPYTLNYTLSQLIFTTAGTFNWVIQGQTRGKQYMSVYNGDGKLLPPANGEMPSSPTYTRLQLPNFAQRLTDVVPTYTRFDIGLGWKHPDGRISINGFVNNVTNIAYATSIISTTGLNLRFFNPPRTAGVRFRVDW